MIGGIALEHVDPLEHFVPLEHPVSFGPHHIPPLLGIAQSSMRFAWKSGIATRLRFESTPMSAGDSTPVIARVSVDPSST
jgi:hypothetical protein